MERSWRRRSQAGALGLSSGLFTAPGRLRGPDGDPRAGPRARAPRRPVRFAHPRRGQPRVRRGARGHRRRRSHRRSTSRSRTSSSRGWTTGAARDASSRDRGGAPPRPPGRLRPVPVRHGRAIRSATSCPAGCRRAACRRCSSRLRRAGGARAHPCRHRARRPQQLRRHPLVGRGARGGLAASAPESAGRTLGALARERGARPAGCRLRPPHRRPGTHADPRHVDGGGGRATRSRARPGSWSAPTATRWRASGVTGQGKPHPRYYGTFASDAWPVRPRAGLLTLPQAICKMTGGSAAALGLADRGLLREGLCADVTVFDPDTIAELCDLRRAAPVCRSVSRRSSSTATS